MLVKQIMNSEINLKKKKYLIRRIISKSEKSPNFYSEKRTHLHHLRKKDIIQEVKYYLFMMVVFSLILFTAFKNEAILDMIAIVDLIILIALIRAINEKEIEKKVEIEFDKKYGNGKYVEVKSLSQK